MLIQDKIIQIFCTTNDLVKILFQTKKIKFIFICSYLNSGYLSYF
jgi:hypothetical protein